jgi:adenylate kinase family enzyme
MFFIIKNFIFIIRKSFLKSLYRKIKFIKNYNFQSKLNFNVLKLFKHFVISEILVKKNRNLIKQIKKHYDEKYTFSQDWFSNNIPVWEYFINKEINKKKKLEYLEIGSYEGRSVIYICENYKNFNLTVVDPYLKHSEIENFTDQNIKKAFKIFKKNINNFKNRIKFYKLKSSEFFTQNKKKYDLIYIDGSHFYKDVIQDFKNSLNVLNINGLVIFDDFTWDHYKNIEHNPIGGILPLIKDNNSISIISVSNQIIIKKIYEREKRELNTIL